MGKRDEPRPDAVEYEAPHRSRKDTRKWCRGKVGVPHDIGVELRSWVQSMTYIRGYEPRCRWMTNYWHKATDEIKWECSHCRRCKNCRRIMEDFLTPTTDCPHYREMPAGPYLCQDCEHVRSEHGRRYGETCHCGCKHFHWTDPTLEPAV